MDIAFKTIYIEPDHTQLPLHLIPTLKIPFLNDRETKPYYYGRKNADIVSIFAVTLFALYVFGCIVEMVYLFPLQCREMLDIIGITFTSTHSSYSQSTVLHLEECI